MPLVGRVFLIGDNLRPSDSVGKPFNHTYIGKYAGRRFPNDMSPPPTPMCGHLSNQFTHKTKTLIRYINNSLKLYHMISHCTTTPLPNTYYNDHTCTNQQASPRNTL